MGGTLNDKLLGVRDVDRCSDLGEEAGFLLSRE